MVFFWILKIIFNLFVNSLIFANLLLDDLVVLNFQNKPNFKKCTFFILLAYNNIDNTTNIKKSSAREQKKNMLNQSVGV